MKELYKELLGRMEFLETEQKTIGKSDPELCGKIYELELCIIRVQQILLKDIK
jgi:hypothetical protein